MSEEEDDVSKQQHYMVHGIQPIEYIVSNGLGFLEGNVVKYISRWRYKDQEKDLRKAMQYLKWQLELAETGKITVPKDTPEPSLEEDLEELKAEVEKMEGELPEGTVDFFEEVFDQLFLQRLKAK